MEDVDQAMFLSDLILNEFEKKGYSYDKIVGALHAAYMRCLIKMEYTSKDMRQIFEYSLETLDVHAKKTKTSSKEER